VGHLAPLGWEPIRLKGDYAWPSEPLQEGFWPLRDRRPVFLDAAYRTFKNRFCDGPEELLSVRMVKKPNLAGNYTPSSVMARKVWGLPHSLTRQVARRRASATWRNHRRPRWIWVNCPDR
jgi:hypothetical protein